MRRCTSRAPAAFTIFTIFRLVVPRTSESSIRTTRLPSRMLRTGIQLHLYAEVADRLLRLDERPADVVVADEPHAQRQPRLLGEADRRAHAGVGDGHDDVGVDRVFAGEHAAEFRPHLVDTAAEHVAVGPREIDVLEHALGQRSGGNGLMERRPLADDEDLARLDVAHVRGADQIERAGFRADNPGVAEPAEREGAEAVRIARRDQPVLA